MYLLTDWYRYYYLSLLLLIAIPTPTDLQSHSWQSSILHELKVSQAYSLMISKKTKCKFATLRFQRFSADQLQRIKTDSYQVQFIYTHIHQPLTKYFQSVMHKAGIVQWNHLLTHKARQQLLEQNSNLRISRREHLQLHWRLLKSTHRYKTRCDWFTNTIETQKIICSTCEKIHIALRCVNVWSRISFSPNYDIRLNESKNTAS